MDEGFWPKARVVLGVCAVAASVIGCGSDARLPVDETPSAESTEASSAQSGEKTSTASASTTLKNASFEDGTAGWIPHVTRGTVLSFEVSQRPPRMLRLKATHSPGAAGVLEAVSSPVRVEPRRSYRVQSTVLLESEPGARGVRQRVRWLGSNGESLEPAYGREQEAGRGATVQLSDTFVAPDEASRARVAVGLVVSGTSRAVIRIGTVTFGGTN